MSTFDDQYRDCLREKAERIRQDKNASTADEISAATCLMVLDGVAEKQDCEMKHRAVVREAIQAAKKEIELDNPISVRKIVTSAAASLPPWLLITGYLVWRLIEAR